MIARSLKAKALVFVVFFIGIATGVLIWNFYETRVQGSRTDDGGRAVRAQRDVNSIHNYLGLDENQKQELNKILEETRAEFRNLQKQSQPQFKAIQDASRNKIRAVMKNDEQRKKYDEFIVMQDKRQRRRN